MRKYPGVLVTKHDDVTFEEVVSLRIRKLPEESEWAFLIGDTVHSLRVALDYLAFSIVTRYPRTLKVEKVAFPICDDPAKYPSLEGRRIGKGVPDKVRDIIKGFQPYQGRHSPDTEPLLVLDTLENVHKHRRLLLAGFSITNVTQAGTDPHIKLTMTSLPAGPLKDGTELYRYIILSPGYSKANMEFQVRAHVGFDEVGPAYGLTVVRELERIRDHLGDDIFPALEPFL